MPRGGPRDLTPPGRAGELTLHRLGKTAPKRLGAALVGMALLAASPASRVDVQASPQSVGARATASWIGLEMPAAGDDGAAGLAVSAAVRLAVGRGRIAVRDSSNGGFLNPHRDEGSDNDVDVNAASGIVASFAADPRIVAMIGGLRRNVGDAVAAAAEKRRLPAVVLSRWSRAPGGTNAFCLCVSPPRLVAFARGAARPRFGPRLLVVLAGEARTLPSQWPHHLGGVPVIQLDPPAPALDPVPNRTVETAQERSRRTARRRALEADAVLVIADERPPALWRSDAFRRWFTGDYCAGSGTATIASCPRRCGAATFLLCAKQFPTGPNGGNSHGGSTTRRATCPAPRRPGRTWPPRFCGRRAPTARACGAPSARGDSTRLPDRSRSTPTATGTAHCWPQRSRERSSR